MQAFRASLDWFLTHGGEEMAKAHMLEAGAITVDVTKTEINWEAYSVMEQMGQFLLIVALTDDGNTIMGYTAGTAQPSIHNAGYQDFVSTAFYTDPLFRQQGVSRLLFEALCHTCKEAGITEINYSVSERAPETAKAVEALGMVKAETTYSINLEKEDG